MLNKINKVLGEISQSLALDGGGVELVSFDEVKNGLLQLK